MVAKTPDYSKSLAEFMGAFPVDLTAWQTGFKTSAELAEKLSAISLAAASSANEVATEAQLETVAALGKLSKAKSDPLAYVQAFGNFWTAQSEAIVKRSTALGEIAKRAQMDSADVLLAAGKTFSEDASAAVKKATDEAVKIANAA